MVSPPTPTHKQAQAVLQPGLILTAAVVLDGSNHEQTDQTYHNQYTVPRANPHATCRTTMHSLNATGCEYCEHKYCMRASMLNNA